MTSKRAASGKQEQGNAALRAASDLDQAGGPHAGDGHARPEPGESQADQLAADDLNFVRRLAYTLRNGSPADFVNVCIAPPEAWLRLQLLEGRYRQRVTRTIMIGKWSRTVEDHRDSTPIQHLVQCLTNSMKVSHEGISLQAADWTMSTITDGDHVTLARLQGEALRALDEIEKAIASGPNPPQAASSPSKPELSISEAMLDAVTNVETRLRSKHLKAARTCAQVLLHLVRTGPASVSGIMKGTKLGRDAVKGALASLRIHSLVDGPQPQRGPHAKYSASENGISLATVDIQ